MKYLNLDVFEYKDFAPNLSADRELSLVTSVSGKVIVFDKHKISKTSKQLTVTAIGKAEIASMRDFIAARRGQLVPFFIASYRADFELYSGASAGATTLVFSGNRLSKFSINRRAASKHMAFIDLASNSILGFFSVDSVENLGGNDHVTLANSTATSFPERTAVSIMQYVRLASDTCKIVYTTAEVADFTFTITDIPNENL